MREIRRLCDLSNSSHVILANDSIDPIKHEVNLTGCHIHVSNGTKEGFSLQHTRRISAFLFVLEPILNAHRPEMRQDSYYSRLLRNWSRFSRQRLGQAFPLPSALEGAAHFMSCKSFDGSCRDIASDFGPNPANFIYYNLVVSIDKNRLIAICQFVQQLSLEKQKVQWTE